MIALTHKFVKTLYSFFVVAGFIPALAIGDRAAFANKRSARLQPRARQPGMHDLKRSHYENQSPYVIASPFAFCHSERSEESGGAQDRLRRGNLIKRGAVKNCPSTVSY